MPHQRPTCPAFSADASGLCVVHRKAMHPTEAQLDERCPTCHRKLRATDWIVTRTVVHVQCADGEESGAWRDRRTGANAWLRSSARMISLFFFTQTGDNQSRHASHTRVGFRETPKGHVEGMILGASLFAFEDRKWE